MKRIEDTFQAILPVICSNCGTKFADNLFDLKVDRSAIPDFKLGDDRKLYRVLGQCSKCGVFVYINCRKITDVLF